jgi:hypothetical protein
VLALLFLLWKLGQFRTLGLWRHEVMYTGLYGEFESTATKGVSYFCAPKRVTNDSITPS